MKFYTKREFAIFSIVFFVFGFVVSALFFNFVGKDKESVAVVESVDKEIVIDREVLNDVKNVNFKSSNMSDEQNSITIYEKLNAGVVNITTEIMGLNWFLEPVPREGGSGSGAIIDEKGYILTNTHVVENAYKVFVGLNDGSQYEGKVVGLDIENDLAVLKIDPLETVLTVIPLGSSKNLKVGQKVLAIGNPYGYDRTLTTGIISGVSRPVRTDKNIVIKNMIQTDASINPGNSGGPLIDSNGRMVGINTMIYSPSGGSIGIGFAVPVDTAIRVLPDLIKYGKVNRGWIDIVPIQLNKTIADYANLPTSKGILISQIKKSSKAYSVLKGGNSSKPVRYGRSYIYFGGDIIVSVNGVKVESIIELFSALENSKPNQKVPVKIYRGNKLMTVDVELSKRPKEFQW